MIYSLLTVAGFNLGLGCFIGYALREYQSTRNFPWASNGQRQTPIEAPQVTSVTQSASDRQAGVTGQDGTGTEVGTSVGEAQNTEHSPVDEMPVTSWSEITRKLQTITSQIQVADASKDGPAKDICSRLQAFVKFVGVQLERCLNGEAPELQREITKGTEDTSLLELNLAQIETTVSNLESLDWTRPVNEILDRMAQEANAIRKLL